MSSINKIIFAVVIGILFFSCTDKKHAVQHSNAVTILSPDTAIHLINGELYYQHELFTGIIHESYSTGNIKCIQRIQGGKQDGLSETFYEDGKKESARWYAKGEKDSVHTGWWPNGNLKYEYHFKNGLYEGMFSEWYPDKKDYQQIMYSNGNELYGRGWRESGKLYMNFVIKDGRRYGLNNSNLCYTVSKQK